MKRYCQTLELYNDKELIKTYDDFLHNPVRAER